jgi:hypothetical protein
MKAGLEEKPGIYGRSSYAAYVGKADGLTDSETAIEMLGGQEYLLAYQGLTAKRQKEVLTRILAKGTPCDRLRD